MMKKYLLVLSVICGSPVLGQEFVCGSYVNEQLRYAVFREVKTVAVTNQPPANPVPYPPGLPPGAQFVVYTGAVEVVTHSLVRIAGDNRQEVIWSDTYKIFLDPARVYGTDPVVYDIAGAAKWCAVFRRMGGPRDVHRVDIIRLPSADSSQTNLHLRLPRPRANADDFEVEQGRFVSFAEDSLYLCTVPYSGKAVNQVTLWKVNLEKGAVEFLGHYDRYLTPVWKSVTDMFPPPPPATTGATFPPSSSLRASIAASASPPRRSC